jgi:molecular chaperone HtpG
VLKEGIAEDPSNRERIAKLLRFSTTRADAEEASVSLAEYVARMKEGQDTIYYVTADTFRAARSSPHLEMFRAKDIEVLLLHERIDEWLVANLHEFDGKPLASVARGDIDVAKIAGEEEKKRHEELAGEHKALVEKLKAALGDRVKEVRVSSRLTESPSCLVADERDMGTNLARILKAVGQDVPDMKPILEVNPEHPIVKRLAPDDARLGDWAALLFDQALLAEGGSLEDPAQYVKLSNELMLSLSR